MANVQSTPARPFTKPDRPVIFNTDHIKKAILDPNFYTMLPEFLPVKRTLESRGVPTAGGCSSCIRRRAATSMTSDFVSVMANLNDDGLERVKKYFGAKRLLVRTVNKSTKRIEMREI